MNSARVSASAASSCRSWTIGLLVISRRTQMVTPIAIDRKASAIVPPSQKLVSRASQRPCMPPSRPLQPMK